VARAQACCAAGTVLTPGRLLLHEDALVGVQMKATGITGSFYPDGTFVRSPPGTAEVDFEQDLIASLRVLSQGQISLTVPLAETWRRAPGISDLGGGVGDIQVNARWDATLAGASRTIPGVAVLASLTLPTGLPPEQATHPLASDSTGTGAIQGALGASLEQTFGDWLVNLTGYATLHSTRVIQGIANQLGPSFNGLVAVGYSFKAGPVAAISATYTGSLDARANGAPLPDSARALLTLGASAGYVISDAWRVQGGVFGEPPAAHAGQNQSQGVGGSVTIFRTW
jgi:hypothetical protein